MTRHDDRVRLRHMLHHAREAVQMVAGRDRMDLHSVRMLELALVRLIEIVGEAAARVTPATRDLYPDVPWQDMVGMRNRIVHGYDRVDLDILWDTIMVDLPPLIAQLEALLAEEDT